jgi:pyruvate formate lyase activating enzyme
MENVPPTPVETLMKAYIIGIDAGLKYVYVGNLDDNEHENTICPKCGELVIERDWRRGIMNIKLKKNKCPKCGEEIAGFF